MSAQPEVKLRPVPSPTTAPPRQTFITIRGLSKRFGAAPLYQSFDLDLPQGRVTSIFGPNGCGKSTLINMIAGLTPVDAGET